MVTVSRRTLLPFMEPILAPTLCSVRAPNPIRASVVHSFCLSPRLPQEVISKIAVNVRTSGGRTYHDFPYTCD